MHSQFTPTAVTDCEVLIGFDKERISEKLGLNSQPHLAASGDLKGMHHCPSLVVGLFVL